MIDGAIDGPPKNGELLSGLIRAGLTSALRGSRLSSSLSASDHYEFFESAQLSVYALFTHTLPAIPARDDRASPHRDSNFESFTRENIYISHLVYTYALGIEIRETYVYIYIYPRIHIALVKALREYIETDREIARLIIPPGEKLRLYDGAEVCN